MSKTEEFDFGNQVDWDAKLQEISGRKQGFTKDERLWTVTAPKDKEYKGSAVIRLLQDPNGDFFITRFSHFISNDTKRKWVEVSPKSFGLDCPASELFSMIRDDASDKVAKDMIPMSEKHYTNIKVIKDMGNPLNDGKHFLFQFGNPLKRLFFNAINPSQEERNLGTAPVNLYSPIDGANINYISGINPNGYQSYDSTKIAQKSAIYKDAKEAVKEIKANCHSLDSFMTVDEVKSYDELAESLSEFMENASHPSFPDFPKTLERWRKKVFKNKSTYTENTSTASETTTSEDTPTSETKVLSEEEKFRQLMGD